jgi:hypothetical protein
MIENNELESLEDELESLEEDDLIAEMQESLEAI